MSRLGRLVAALLVVGTACTTSELDPNASVRLAGEVHGPDGAAVRDAPVVLVREPNPGDVLGGLAAGMLTLGVACAVEPEPRLCDEGNTRRTGTDSSGRFAYELTGRDTQDGLGFASTFELTAVAPAVDDEVSGPSTAGRFLIQREQLELPVWDTWRPQLGGSSEAGVGRLDWSSAPAALGNPTSVRFDDGIGTVIWELAADHDGSASFDVRLLEGSAGAISVQRTTQRSLPASDLDLTFSSGRRAYRSTGSLPTSRHAGCTSIDLGTRQAVTRAPCELTDGKLAERDPALVGPIVIDLGRVVAPSLIAVRGCDDECTIETSTDGASFLPMVTATAPFTAFTPPPETSMRYLRLDDPSSITEVSVWDDAPNGTFELVSPAELTAATAGDRPEALRPKSDDGPPVVLVVVAVLLAGGVLLAIGMALGRRRATT